MEGNIYHTFIRIKCNAPLEMGGKCIIHLSEQNVWQVYVFGGRFAILIMPFERWDSNVTDKYVDAIFATSVQHLDILS